MPNTNLPESVVDGQTGRIDDINEAWTEINRLSRDTGWRDFSGLLVNGWTATRARIRRVNDLTYISVRGLVSGGGSAAFMNMGANALSANFFQSRSARSPLFKMSDGGEVYFTHNTASVFALMTGMTDTGAYELDWIIPARAEWPSYLPPAV